MLIANRPLPKIFRKHLFHLPIWRRNPVKSLFSFDLKFKIQEQQKSNWCWAAVSQAVSHYTLGYQKDNTQVYIASRLTGCSCTRACQGINHCNRKQLLPRALSVARCSHKAISHHPSSPFSALLPSIIDRIHLDLPIPCRIQWTKDNTGHFSVIYGYYIGQEKWIFVADPDTGYSEWDSAVFYANNSFILTNTVTL